MAAIKVFLSYSHKDEELRTELESHLKILEKTGLISCWHDRKITGGSEWKGVIDQHMKNADIILLLISADFLNSEYCYDIEMKSALEAHQSGTSVVVPVILRSVVWEHSQLAELQALPKDGKPVVTWEFRDTAWADVTSGIMKITQELQPVSDETTEGKKPDLNTMLQAAGDSKSVTTHISSDPSSIEANVGRLVTKRPDIAAKISAYRHEEQLDRQHAQAVIDDVASVVEGGLPVEMSIMLIMPSLADRSERTIKLLIQRLNVIVAIEEASLSPASFGLPTSSLTLDQLRVQMAQQTQILSALGGTMKVYRQNIMDPIRRAGDSE